MANTLRFRIILWVIGPATLQLLLSYLFFGYVVFPKLQRIESDHIVDSTSRVKDIYDQTIGGLEALATGLSTDPGIRALVIDGTPLDRSELDIKTDCLTVIGANGQMHFIKGHFPVKLNLQGAVAISGIAHNDGSVAPIAFGVAAIRDAQGYPVGLLALGRDFSEGKCELSVLEQGSRIYQEAAHLIESSAYAFAASITSSHLREHFYATDHRARPVIVEARFPREIGEEIRRQFAYIVAFLLVAICVSCACIIAMLDRHIASPVRQFSQDLKHDDRTVPRVSSSPVELLGIAGSVQELHEEMEEVKTLLGWESRSRIRAKLYDDTLNDLNDIHFCLKDTLAHLPEEAERKQKIRQSMDILNKVSMDLHAIAKKI